MNNDISALDWFPKLPLFAYGIFMQTKHQRYRYSTLYPYSWWLISIRKTKMLVKQCHKPTIFGFLYQPYMICFLFHSHLSLLISISRGSRGTSGLHCGHPWMQDAVNTSWIQDGPLEDIMVTIWLFNIAMENSPFIDGLPFKHGDFPWLR